jgi:phenylalanyl-tRNA synthetase alpha chain
MNPSELEKLQGELLGAVAAANDLAALEDVRVSALGKKGQISELMKGLGAMAPEDRKAFGQAVNGVKQAVSDALFTLSARSGTR